MVRTQRFNFIFHIIPFSILLLAASFFKVSFIFGSKMAFFSGVDIISPLSGAIGGSLGALLLFFLRFCFQEVTPSLFILRHLPGLCGAWYWSSSSVVIRALVPGLCMVLFLLHPVGIQAYAYSFFWLIPLTIYFFNVQSLFLQALGGTFVTHAVGSVIWLYTVPMMAGQWWALIPVVILERVVFATIQVIVLWLYKHAGIILHKYTLIPTIKKLVAKAPSL
jgi:hypothetical protein